MKIRKRILIFCSRQYCKRHNIEKSQNVNVKVLFRNVEVGRRVQWSMQLSQGSRIKINKEC